MSTWFHTYGFADVRHSLLLGAYPLDRTDIDTLAHMQVGRVLNLAEDDEYPPGSRAIVQAALAQAGIGELRVPFTDFGRLPAQRLDEAVAIVVRWLREDQLCYLHCRAGRQRSATVAAGALAVAEGLGLDDALREVQRRRPSAQPLAHQVDDLRAWWKYRNGVRSGPEETD
ncbi:MAG: protein-tyrosine phosphatase family protein [Solirubrobacteraceae bacterium]